MRSPAEGAQYFDIRESADSSSPSPPSKFSNRFRFQDSRLDIDPPLSDLFMKKIFEYIFYQQLEINKISIDRCILNINILEFYSSSFRSSIHSLVPFSWRCSKFARDSSYIWGNNIESEYPFVSLLRFKIFNIPSRCKNYSFTYSFYDAIIHIYIYIYIWILSRLFLDFLRKLATHIFIFARNSHFATWNQSKIQSRRIEISKLLATKKE